MISILLIPVQSWSSAAAAAKHLPPKLQLLGMAQLRHLCLKNRVCI